MNKHVIILSAAAVLLFSCSREADQVIQPGETITFTAALAGSDETRTILHSDGTSVWWDAAEQINVFFSNKASGRFTSTNSQPQAIVDFQGNLPIVVGSVETENPPHAYWAVYPYNAANTCDGESVTLTVPSTQRATEGTFADKIFPSIATSTNFYLAFYNVCGGVRFTVANEGITSVTFKANNGEPLTGKVKVGFDSVPVVKSVSEGISEVVVNAPTGGFVPGKYYFAALLPQTLSKGVSLSFKREDGKVASTSLDNSITINRSRFGKMDEKDKGLEFVDDGGGHDPSDNIEFADSKVKERLVARFDTNGDGELSYEEAAAVTSMEGVLTLKTYTSFDEFQYFTGVTSVPAQYFMGWTKLTSIVLPPSINTIGRQAFQQCSLLTSIILPQGLTTIEIDTFYGCSSLSSVSIPESVTKITDDAFAECPSLTSISIPEGVTSIGQYAFGGCSNLSSFIIPENVTTIGSRAFRSCDRLTSIVIPKRVTNIGTGVWARCRSLTSIIVDPNNTIYDSREGCNAIIETTSNTLISGCSKTFIPKSVTAIEDNAFNGCPITSLSIPDGVLSIGSQAFAGSDLISITIPESVTVIENYAFVECERLTSVVIPESITKIETSTFEGCKNLNSITIPESVSVIRSNAFYGCTSLTSITIPEGVDTIEDFAFAYCSSLNAIIVLAETPPSCWSHTFMETNNAPIFVPTGSVEAYKEASGWSYFKSRIQAIQE